MGRVISTRPIATTLVAISVVLLAMSLISAVLARRDWRARMAEEVKE